MGKKSVPDEEGNGSDGSKNFIWHGGDDYESSNGVTSSKS